jgi:hypothetical protein
LFTTYGPKLYLSIDVHVVPIIKMDKNIYKYVFKTYVDGDKSSVNPREIK